jgi:hypothetical protein
MIFPHAVVFLTRVRLASYFSQQVGPPVFLKGLAMKFRKGIFALAVAAAVGFAGRGASAGTVSLNASGHRDGQSFNTTVNCTFDLKALGIKGKNVQLTGGIIFAATCPPDFNAPGNVIENEKPPCNPSPSEQCLTSENNEPECQQIINDGPANENCGPQAEWDCHDPYVTFTGPEGIPTLTEASVTPLPAPVWGGMALMAGLGAVRKMRRRVG